MQRLFIANECYQDLKPIPRSDRQNFHAGLHHFLTSDKPTLSPVTSGDANVHTVDLPAGYRALLRKFADPSADMPAWVLLAIAESKKLQALAESLRFTWDGETAGVIRVVSSSKKLEAEKPFSRFQDFEFKDWGIPDSAFSKVRDIQTEDELSALEGDLTPKAFFRLVEIFEKYNHLDESSLAILNDRMPSKELNELEGEISQGLEDIFHSDRFFLVEKEEQLKKFCDGDLPVWHLFPLPDQKKWVTRNSKTPILVRGVSGSGKSSMALYRALYLAEEIPQGKILLTTPFKQSEKFFQEDLRQLGNPFSDRLEVTNIYAWAGAYLQKLGIPAEVNPAQALELLKEAIDSCRQGMPNMIPAHLDFNFVREEVGAVIKGRALHGQPDYLSLPRRGLGTPLTNEERRHLWRIYSKYQELLNAKNMLDMDDLLVHAHKHLKNSPPKSSYVAIIIDDVQDVPPVGIRLFHTLVKNTPNGLFMLSDVAQRLGRSGETLDHLGIDLSSKSQRLRTNCRNTREISDAAQSILDKTRFDEIDGSGQTPIVQAEVPRRGAKPQVTIHESEDKEVLWLMDLINELTSPAYGYQHGDIALVARSNRYLTTLELNLTQAQIPSLSFKKAGHERQGNSVKISHYNDCKGTEFPVVILLEVNDGVLPKVPAGIDTEELATHLGREQRLLYTAMCRAKDLLFISAYSPASRFLEPLYQVLGIQNPDPQNQSESEKSE